VTDIHTIDLHDLDTPGSIAAYLLLDGSEAVLVETGPSRTMPALVAALAEHGLEPRDVRNALVTHIHFDHAGAAGHLAGHGATIHVHEFGARHLIDPSRLVASARRIYGDAMEQRWGPILPVPPAQVVPVHDGDVLRFGAIELRAVETPGHARHHHAFVLDGADGRVCFTGDAAATVMAESDFISLPTPPPEFDLEQWLVTLDRIDGLRCDTIYPTHFGRVDDPSAHLRRVRWELVTHFAVVRSLLEQGLDEPVIHEVYRRFVDEQADRLGVPAFRRRFYVSDSVAQMNVTGILRYLQTTAAREKVAPC
jgi:glyoxylase-like metal-dependent hydrolase (beta-lactamase superfamily II)